MSSSSATRRPPPLGRLFDVEGRRLMLHRSGKGGPTVVFLPGAGLVGLDYLNIHEQAARFTTSVIYDRGGTGWSDDVALPRPAAAVAAELRSLLRAAGAPSPYILVGHSLGGAYARRYAQLFPGEVAGLLLLDPAHEGYDAAPRQSVAAQLRQILAILPVLANLKGFYRPMFERMLAAWPDDVRKQLVEYHLRAWRRGLQEAKTLSTDVMTELRGGGGRPEAPMIVLTAMGIDPFMAAFAAEPYLRELNTLKRDFYDAFARSAPRGEAREVMDAGHSTLHTDRPDAVVAALRDLLAATTASRGDQMACKPGSVPLPA